MTERFDAMVPLAVAKQMFLASRAYLLTMAEIETVDPFMVLNEAVLSLAPRIELLLGHLQPRR